MEPTVDGVDMAQPASASTQTSRQRNTIHFFIYATPFHFLISIHTDDIQASSLQDFQKSGPCDSGPRVSPRAAANTNEKRNHETSILNVRGSHKRSIQRTLNSRSP